MLKYDKLFNINMNDLKGLTLNELFITYNIGFLLLKSNDEKDPDKLKHNLQLIYNNANKETKFILLYELFNENTGTKNLTNIMIKNNDNYITFMTLEDLYENGQDAGTKVTFFIPTRLQSKNLKLEISYINSLSKRL